MVTTEMVASFLRLLRESFANWRKDKASRLAAALSFYAIFSLAPLLVVVIAAAGSLVIVLLWVYYSAQVLLLGAEFTHIYATRQRAPAGVPAMAAPPRSPAGVSASASRVAPPLQPSWAGFLAGLVVGYFTLRLEGGSRAAAEKRSADPHLNG